MTTRARRALWPQRTSLDFAAARAQASGRVHGLLLIAVIAFAMGFEPLFNGPLAITAVVLLFLGAIADSMRRRFRRR